MRRAFRAPQCPFMARDVGLWLDPNSCYPPCEAIRGRSRSSTALSLKSHPDHARRSSGRLGTGHSDINTPTFGRSASAPASQIEYNVGARPAAANQEIAFPRRLERFGAVIDSAGDKPGLATVADAGATRPPHRHIAGLGKFE